MNISGTLMFITTFSVYFTGVSQAEVYADGPQAEVYADGLDGT